jgi:DNA polymerase-3 subunit delta
VKIETRDAAGFLRDPGKCRAVLLYGENEGLIRERASALTRLVAGTLNDPFNVVELDREGWPNLAGEMAAISMMGGRRVIRVREAAEALLEPLKSALKTAGDALIIIEAAELGRGKLRSFAEAAPDAASVPCYPEEGKALGDLIKSVLAETKARAEPEVVTWLAETLGGDRAVVRGEVEKLALLAGAGGVVNMDMARSCTGDSAGASADEALLAATSGDLRAADFAVEHAMAEGLAGVALLRMALGHLQKMHLARLRMETGMGAGDAVKTMGPPVYFRSVGAMTQSLTLWPGEGLLRAIEVARNAEFACKQTGSNPDILAKNFVTWLARQSASRKGR